MRYVKLSILVTIKSYHSFDNVIYLNYKHKYTCNCVGEWIISCQIYLAMTAISAHRFNNTVAWFPGIVLILDTWLANPRPC